MKFTPEVIAALQTLKDAAEKSNINYGTLKSRYYCGDTGDRLFRPVKNQSQ